MKVTVDSMVKIMIKRLLAYFVGRSICGHCGRLAARVDDGMMFGYVCHHCGVLKLTTKAVPDGRKVRAKYIAVGWWAKLKYLFKKRRKI